MSEFSQEEQDAISAMAAAIGAPWGFAADAYRKAKAQYSLRIPSEFLKPSSRTALILNRPKKARKR